MAGGGSSGGVDTSTPTQDAPSVSPSIAPIAVSGVVPFIFGYQNLAASLSAAKLYRAIPGAAMTFAQQGISMLNRGSIVGIAVRATAGITAGTATFVPYIEQAPSAVQAVWASSNRMSVSFAPGLATFGPDQELDVRVSTQAGFAPTTTNVELIVYVTFG
jgi:hypothetical protein